MSLVRTGFPVVKLGTKYFEMSFKYGAYFKEGEYTKPEFIKFYYNYQAYFSDQR